MYPDGVASDVRSNPATRFRGTRRNTASLVRRFTFRGVGGFLTIFIVFEVAIPAFTRLAVTLPDLSGVTLALALGAGALEALSLLFFAKLTLSVLPKGSPTSIWTVFKVDLSALAVSHVIPGGGAAGAGVSLRLFKRAGISPADSAFALATQGVGSAAILNVILWVCLLISIPIYGFKAQYVVVGGVGVLAIGGLAGMLILFRRDEAKVIRRLGSINRKVPLLRRVDLVAAVRSASGNLTSLLKQRELLKRAAIWAALNWLLDASSLYVMVVAFGGPLDPVGVLVAYGLANVLSFIPITPGGLGVIETVATAALVLFGTHAGAALLAVAVWRLFNFWVPIPVGVGAYITLRLHEGTDAGDLSKELDDDGEDEAK